MFTQQRHCKIEGSVGKQVKICLITKASMKGRNSWLGFSHAILMSIGCDVNFFSNFGVVGAFYLWWMGLA